jgi:myo-inositol-1(or 4)-monophosphatase
MFTHNQLQEISEQVIELSREVGTYLRSQQHALRNDDVDSKSLNSFVTYVDRTSEEKLVKGLSEILPRATFLTEEETVAQENSDVRWIIDPLDGTTNYIHGMPQFSTSVGLEVNNELVVGVIEEPSLGETFHAFKGGGAWINDLKIQVSNKDNLTDSLLATGFPYFEFNLMSDYLDLLRELMKNSRGVRRLGSAALDLAYVACGRFDSFYEYSLNPWDVAAGVVLVKEAGGIVTDFFGKDDYLHGQTIVASNPNIHSEMLEKIGNYFEKPFII